ncbi:hypothetical protein LTR12_013951 [Friedmanniomyces endolithicus]|nr:hypothetical protein LTR12_013951 [Friedmanniomyces endolithicus]
MRPRRTVPLLCGSQLGRAQTRFARLYSERRLEIPPTDPTPTVPRRLNDRSAASFTRPRFVAHRTRSRTWQSLEQMTYSGGLKWAWKLVEETETNVGVLKNRIVFALLEGVEHCPRSIWQTQGETIRRLLLRKYDVELAKVERAFSIAWVSTDLEDEAEGYHVLLEDQETIVMERLSHEDFKLEEDFGYPYESVVPSKERDLHDAVEVDESANE